MSSPLTVYCRSRERAGVFIPDDAERAADALRRRHGDRHAAEDWLRGVLDALNPPTPVDPFGESLLYHPSDERCHR